MFLLSVLFLFFNSVYVLCTQECGLLDSKKYVGTFQTPLWTFHSLLFPFEFPLVSPICYVASRRHVRQLPLKMPCSHRVTSESDQIKKLCDQKVLVSCQMRSEVTAYFDDEFQTSTPILPLPMDARILVFEDRESIYNNCLNVLVY